MRKILLGVVAATAIVTPLVATAGSANAAGTPRCQTDYVTSSSTTAMFTANQSKDTVGQFGNVWKHDYTVTANTDGTFTGTGQITDNGIGAVVWTETITGTFTDSPDDADLVSDHVTFNTVPVGGGATFAVANQPMNGTTVPVESSWTDNIIEFQITPPVFTVVTAGGVTDFANHGEYVTAMGGGSIAAQECAGMPLVSKQGK